jgi:hypothetical protein
MTASKRFPAKNLLQMLLECLQVTLRLKDPCDLGGALSDIGSGGHVGSRHSIKAVRKHAIALDKAQEEDIFVTPTEDIVRIMTALFPYPAKG